MHTHTHNTRIKGSITFGVVFGLGLLSLTLAGIALSAVTNNIGTHRNELSGLRSLVTADSAAREGVYRYLHSSSFSSSTDWNGAGEEDINAVLASTITVDRSLWPDIRVRGNAKHASTERAVEYTVRPSDYDLAFDHALYANGDIELGGRLTIHGSVYSGSNSADTIDIGNEAASVNGYVYSVGEVGEDEEDNIKEGEILEGRPYMAAPTIRVSGYEVTSDKDCYAIVGQNKQDVGDIDWDDCNIVYIRPDPSATSSLAHISANPEFSGVLYIKGNAKITNGTFTCDTGYGFPNNPRQQEEQWCKTACSNPLAIYVDGTLEIEGGEICGLVYVTGQTTFGAGNPSITGSLMSAQYGASVSGTGDITYSPLIMSNWEHIGGLSPSGLNEKAETSNWTER